MTRTTATFAPPVMAAGRWLEGVTFPDDRPLINVCQAAPVAPPPELLRRAMAEAASRAAYDLARLAVEETGVDCEIVDIRTISPLDVDTITASVNKTGRCIVVHEATRFAGFGAEIAARIQKDCFYNLEAPIRRTAGWDTPYPHAFEWQYFPGKKRLVADIRSMMEAE